MDKTLHYRASNVLKKEKKEEGNLDWGREREGEDLPSAIVMNL